MTDEQRMRRVDKAQMAVLFRTPFFAVGVAKLPVIFDDTVLCNGQPTACTNGDEIRWHREHFDSLPDPVVVTVLAHEVCHCMLGHIWRFPTGGDGSTWNEACDHAVNTMLEEFGQIVKGQGLADPFPMPDGCLHDPQFKGMSEEAIYQRLHQKGGGGSGNGSGQAGGSGAKSGGPPSKSGSSAKGGGKAPPNQGQSAQRKPFGEFTPSSKGQDVQKRDKSDWEGTLIQSCAIAKGRGTLPGSLERFVHELVSPKVPWVDLLRNFLREHAADDWNWMRPNTYYDDTSFILPSLHSERMGAVVFGSDWSGSTYGTLVEKFHVEKQSCLDDMKPAKLIDIGFDTKVVSEREYVVGDTIDPKIKGGGGTDFRDFFRRCDELNPKCVVVLTDLDGTFPKVAPEYPVLWVSYGGGDKAPFGEVIQAED